MSKKSKKESTLYYFHSVGCAFCKQIDPIIEKLNSNGYDIFKLDLSETDNDGLYKEIKKKYKIECGTPLLVDVSNGKHICGQANESMIESWAKGEEIPKPLSPAPPLPQNFDDEEQIEKFKDAYEKWKDENNHIPNLHTAEQIIKRYKTQWEARKNQQQSLDGRITSIEQKLNRLMNHLGVK